jgi:hypothetical protein
LALRLNNKGFERPSGSHTLCIVASIGKSLARIKQSA